MEILFNGLLFLFGLFVLVAASDWLIQASVKISLFFRLTPLFIGLVIIAFGTSAPEAGVGIVATLKNQGEITLANIIGSNIANIALALGLCSIFVPLQVDKGIFKKEFPFLAVSTLALYFAGFDLVISRMEGFIFLLLMIIFVFSFIKSSRDGFIEKETKSIKLNSLFNKVKSPFITCILLLLALAGVVWGAHLMVDGGVYLARFFGISPWIIGITVFALGTSLPEIASSFSAAIKRVPSISIGNIIGSNIFNILLVIGVAALIKPIYINPSVLKLELPILLGFTFLLFTVMLTHYKIVRIEGLILTLSYVGFLIWLIAGKI
ncbi:MAG: calcium/sodium antiporter [Candidatus Omnitrophica bacterium]|nr:calcium/sodium antiporter [Candidatus Omnitrophota bacterium]MCF7879058.1 calcium/sodium antiporter [Candidatus Omnitrophota bacterium]MCF7893252.1 calcium/sodium antiporter [Candidatus Omnitrophota bacterium]